MFDDSLNHTQIYAAVEAERKRLYALADVDAASAIAEVKALVARRHLNALNVRLIQASLFVDAGARLNDESLVKEGVTIFRELNHLARPNMTYNLANGLSTLATIQSRSAPDERGVVEIQREANLITSRQNLAPRGK
jgi:hypothetical protein